MKEKMARSAWDYRCSCVPEDTKGKDPQGIVDGQKLLDICGDWEFYLMQSQPILGQTLESHLNTGKPLGSDNFIRIAEQVLGLGLEKKKPSPKSKDR